MPRGMCKETRVGARSLDVPGRDLALVAPHARVVTRCLRSVRVCCEAGLAGRSRLSVVCVWDIVQLKERLLEPAIPESHNSAQLLLEHDPLAVAGGWPLVRVHRAPVHWQLVVQRASPVPVRTHANSSCRSSTASPCRSRILLPLIPVQYAAWCAQRTRGDARVTYPVVMVIWRVSLPVLPVLVSAIAASLSRSPGSRSITSTGIVTKRPSVPGSTCGARSAQGKVDSHTSFTTTMAIAPAACARNACAAIDSSDFSTSSTLPLWSAEITTEASNGLATDTRADET